MLQFAKIFFCSFDAKIDSFIVQGVPSGKSVPTIVTSRQTLAKSNLPLLSVLFEMNPLDGSCDHKLDLKAQPLEITYNAVSFVLYVCSFYLFLIVLAKLLVIKWLFNLLCPNIFFN